MVQKYPLSLLPLVAASSPKGTPYGNAGNFAATAKAVPLGKVAANEVSRRKGYLPANFPATQKAPPFGGAGEHSEPERVYFTIYPNSTTAYLTPSFTT